jgi:hypothetical protein
VTTIATIKQNRNLIEQPSSTILDLSIIWSDASMVELRQQPLCFCLR